MKKNLSIRNKITIYYALVLILVTVSVFGIFFVTADLQTKTVSKGTLLNAVQASFDDVEYENNIIEIDNDFNIYYKGVTLLVYNTNGTLIKGVVPMDFPEATPLRTGDYKEIKAADETWLVYDLLNTYDNGQDIWIRGIYAMDNGMATLNAILKIMCFALPLILLICILAGRRITKKAFEPISDITNAASNINNGNDLSKRLPAGENRDELYYLTATLNQMISRLEDAFNAEKSFSSDVSHELKTPLAVVLAECEYTLAQNRSINEYKESLETIQKQCRRTLSLIQQLLQLSRTMDNSLLLEKEDFNISVLCHGIIEELAKFASEKNVRLKSDIEDGITINGDETLIMRMILNLMTNAIKYNREEGYVRLQLNRESSDNSVKIMVEDNGIGISPEDQKKIFNRFYKVEKSRVSEEDSFGLGLSMVKWIAESHGGQIILKSKLGEGSSFTVIL